MAGARVAVIDSKGCSRLFFGISSSFASLGSHHFVEPMSPSSSAAAREPVLQATGPFTGLVICVTGLSKEARKQVMSATERLGGQYSSDLHPQCTHLVVQSFGGRKFEHALKHGSRNGLFVVTLGWFVDSVRRNIRLSESLYSVKHAEENGLPMREVNQITGFTGNENSCIPTLVPGDNKSSYLTRQSHQRPPGNEYSENKKTSLASACLYVDSDISSDLRTKVVDAAVREGANFIDHWFIGCSASHVVCEGTSVQKYIGHANNLVTPLWVIKTAKEKSVQRLVHLSSDLARQVGMILQNFENGILQQDTLVQDAPTYREPPGYKKPKENLEGRKQKIELAKMGVRTRRARRMQIPIRPITPSTLLDSICWSISDLTLTASVYTGSSPFNDVNEQHTSVFFDARGDGRDSEASFDNFTRPLKESEKEELIFKNQFLTILFPIDRFGEMGPSSRTFFSEGGFTCIQVLDHIYSFYQENMLTSEIDVAIHTDSRHADRLRSIFASKESIDQGVVPFKRIDFMGSRRSLEMLKRVLGDNNSNVYELLIRA